MSHIEQANKSLPVQVSHLVVTQYHMVSEIYFQISKYAEPTATNFCQFQK